MDNKRNRNTVLYVVFILLAGIINLFTHTRSALVNSVMFSANFIISENFVGFKISFS